MFRCRRPIGRLGKILSLCRHVEHWGQKKKHLFSCATWGHKYLQRGRTSVLLAVTDASEAVSQLGNQAHDARKHPSGCPSPDSATLLAAMIHAGKNPLGELQRRRVT